MPRLTILIGLLAGFLLAGCDETPADRAADSIRDQSQN